MALNLDDQHGSFAIAIEEHDIDEIDVLRLEVAAGRRAATFLKNAFGRDAMLKLMAEEVRESEVRWRTWVGASEGRYRASTSTFRVEGFCLDRFWAYFKANAGEALQFKMHPEHYVSQFTAGADGSAVISETWGSAKILSFASFSEPQALRDAGIDIDPIWEADAVHRVAAIGRSSDGMFIAAVMHQLIPAQAGFRFKTCAFLPEAVPAEVWKGLEEHAAIEFINLIRIAREASLSEEGTSA